MATYTGSAATASTNTPYYQTITYSDLLQRISHIGGVEVERLLTTDSTALRDYINSALRRAWNYYEWPDLMDSVETTVGNLSLYREYDVLGITQYDPKTYTHPRHYTWKRTADGYHLVNDTLESTSTIYLIYRYEFYPFKGSEYSSGTTYALGDMVYETDDGEYYRSLANGNSGNALTETAWWDKRSIPDFLVEFTRYKTLADWREAEGQGEKAVRLESKAWNELNLEIERFERQKNIQQQPRVRLRSGG